MIFKLFFKKYMQLFSDFHKELFSRTTALKVSRQNNLQYYPVHCEKTPGHTKELLVIFIMF